MGYVNLQPKRTVPASLKWNLFWSGINMRIGSMFLVGGILGCTVFIGQADLSGWRFTENSTSFVTGTIISTEETKAVEGNESIQKYYYTFESNLKQKYQGTSYGKDDKYKSGDVVSIEYLSSSPEISRIQSMRRDIFSPYTLFILLFPIVGIIFLHLGLRINIPAIKLLETGKLTRGVFVEKYTTGWSGGGNKGESTDEYAFVYNFIINGVIYTTVYKSYSVTRMTDEDGELIIYNPNNPEENFVVDAFPGGIKNYITSNLTIF